MRNFKSVVSTGCFFLCLGGWVYSGQLNAADEVNQAINTAVAQAATPGATAALPEGTQIAQATDPAPVAAAPAAAATAPVAVPTTKPTDLQESVVNVEVDGKVKQINFSDMDITTALYFFSLKTH